MKVFLYEFVTGGGLYDEHGRAAVPDTLIAEGTAMITALAADFAAIPDVETCVLRDTHFWGLTFPGCRMHDVSGAADHEQAVARLAAEADWSLIIAPEFSGHLLRLCQWVTCAGGRLLGPGPALVELAGDKQATAARLEDHSVPTPRGIAIIAGQRLPEDFSYPAVLKPRCGAGSMDVRLIERWTADECTPDGTEMRLERYCPGLAVSVAWICGPVSRFPLVPCRQHLSGDGRFTYAGGSLPLPPALARRAIALSGRAVDSLPQPLGYLGVDLVLGDDPYGRGDYVIEINPRLTTSYVGLRAAAETNLAEAILTAAEGGEPRLSFRTDELQFEADGRVSRPKRPSEAQTCPISVSTSVERI